MLCRHCRCRVANRPRRLCMRCYARPDVRARFPVICRFRRLGVPDYFGASKPAPASTRALPGTREKVMVLAERASRREALWHALDARWDEQVMTAPKRYELRHQEATAYRAPAG